MSFPDQLTDIAVQLKRVGDLGILLHVPNRNFTQRPAAGDFIQLPGGEAVSIDPEGEARVYRNPFVVAGQGRKWRFEGHAADAPIGEIGGLSGRIESGRHGGQFQRTGCQRAENIVFPAHLESVQIDLFVLHGSRGKNAPVEAWRREDILDDRDELPFTRRHCLFDGVHRSPKNRAVPAS